MIPAQESLKGFPISSYGETHEYEIAYLLQHGNTQLTTTIDDITTEDIDPDKILQFMQEKGAISNAREWKFEKWTTPRAIQPKTISGQPLFSS